MWDLKADDALVRGYRNSLAVGYQSHPKVSRIEERIAEIDREMDSRNNIRNRVRSADFQTRQNELAAERDTLQSDLEMMKDNRIEMTEELLSLIHSVGGSFDFEDTFQKITETVTIHDRSVFTVRFLCGLEVYYDGR
jgi:phosphoenolpyruvate carboxylase